MVLERLERQVLEPEQKLRHLPFFEEVASHDEGDAAWRSATAGLVVLRLVDAWLEEGRSVVADDGWSVRSVRAAIESMDDGTPLKPILDRVVDALHEEKPDIHVVVTPLMAYAKGLEYDAKWPLAVDVYHSVLAHLHPREDGDASIAAHMRLGYCYRNLQMMEEATRAFATASTIAGQAGDIVGVLLARVNEAHLLALRGNLPRAEEMLDETISRARGTDFQDVRSRALHTRANVAHFRGNYELAVRFAYDAFSDSLSQTQRDRILSDIAVSFLELGVYSAARDAYLVLSTTAQEQYMRWASSINLMEIAALSGSEAHFELYRRQLAAETLPPYLQTAFELHTGAGYGIFGNHAKARAHLERAIALAGEHRINQYLFEAEEALRDLEKTSPPHRVQTEIPLDVREVANAIKAMAGAL